MSEVSSSILSRFKAKRAGLKINKPITPVVVDEKSITPVLEQPSESQPTPPPTPPSIPEPPVKAKRVRKKAVKKEVVKKEPVKKAVKKEVVKKVPVKKVYVRKTKSVPAPPDEAGHLHLDRLIEEGKKYTPAIKMDQVEPEVEPEVEVEVEVEVEPEHEPESEVNTMVNKQKQKAMNLQLELERITSEYNQLKSKNLESELITDTSRALYEYMTRRRR